MADNYLENHYEDYLKRKAAWEKSLHNKGGRVISTPARPEDESL